MTGLHVCYYVTITRGRAALRGRAASLSERPKGETMGSSKFLGEFEQMVLLAILHLKDGAYGRAIRKELESRANRTVTHGASYVTLDRMVSKGLLESELRDPEEGRGGRARRYFRVTPDGIQALRASRAALQNLWNGLETVLEEP